MISALLTRVPLPVLTDKQIYRLLFTATLRHLSSVSGRDQDGSSALFSARGRAAPVKSIFAETRETGSSTLLIAFMG